MNDLPTPSLTPKIYELVASLARHKWPFQASDLPNNGIYFFFETGELTTLYGNSTDRIVRVGTHRVDDRVQVRLRSHFRGNRRGSIFRRHVGNALLNAGEIDPAIAALVTTTPNAICREFEVAISAMMTERFSFAVVRINSRPDRLQLEAGLIAALARQPHPSPSVDWLGNHSVHPEIRESGLWNRQHTNGEPISYEQLERFTMFINESV